MTFLSCPFYSKFKQFFSLYSPPSSMVCLSAISAFIVWINLKSFLGVFGAICVRKSLILPIPQIIIYTSRYWYNWYIVLAECMDVCSLRYCHEFVLYIRAIYRFMLFALLCKISYFMILCINKTY